MENSFSYLRIHGCYIIYMISILSEGLYYINLFIKSFASDDIFYEKFI